MPTPLHILIDELAHDGRLRHYTQNIDDVERGLPHLEARTLQVCVKLRGAQGDRAQVPLRCSKCSCSSYIIDRIPRYEIFTGVYLPCLHMPCYNCFPKHAAFFVPVDTTMPFKTFKSVVDAYNYANYRQIAKDMEFASRTDLEAMKSGLLRTWIRSQGFECQHNRCKAVLVEGANDVPRMKRAERLDLARRIWDNPDIAHSTPITPDEARPCEDLERLSKNGLHTWILSRDYGVTAFKSTSREELLDQAGVVWDHLESFSDDCGDTRPNGSTAKHKKLNFAAKEIKTPKIRKRHPGQSGEAPATSSNSVKVPKVREELRQMAMKNLTQWIRSQGVSIRQGDREKKRVLALAERTWDAIESGTLNDLKKGRKPKKVELSRLEEIFQQTDASRPGSDSTDPISMSVDT
ncbi:hypothetical protein B7494_g1588 [Chlorociboria aeruginascens]|nr:hypothetical protein B7494_g1588 [Chlorociboria aeruginascens]